MRSDSGEWIEYSSQAKRRNRTIELTRRETTTSSIRPSRMTGSLVPLASNDLLYRAQVGRADHSTPRQSARPCYCIFAAPPIIVARDGGHLDDMPKMRPFTVFKKRRGITTNYASCTIIPCYAVLCVTHNTLDQRENHQFPLQPDGVLYCKDTFL